MNINIYKHIRKLQFEICAFLFYSMGKSPKNEKKKKKLTEFRKATDPRQSTFHLKPIST